MKFFLKRKDGGPDSNVTGYWLIEWKNGFSIALLNFSQGSRENFHNHAFNAVSWFFWGRAYEERLINTKTVWTKFLPSILPVITTKDNLHRVYGIAESTWALTFRGPWSKTWNEYNESTESLITLSEGRKIV